MLKDSLQRNKLGKKRKLLGFKPTTYWLQCVCSTTELQPFCKYWLNWLIILEFFAEIKIMSLMLLFASGEFVRQGEGKTSLESREQLRRNTECPLRLHFVPLSHSRLRLNWLRNCFIVFSKKINRQSEHLPGLGECCHGPGRKVAGSNLATIYPQNIRPRF